MRQKALTFATLIAFATIARALTSPEIREGYWKSHTVSTDKPSNKVTDGTYNICRNHAFDHHLDDQLATPGCTISTNTLEGHTRTVAVSCKVANTVIASRSVTTYVSDTAVHSETHATYTPAFYGMTQEDSIVDWTYIGACPAGIQPGDRVDQDGSVMHLWKHDAPAPRKQTP